MPSPTPTPLLRVEYYEAAQEYLKSLPPEHFMEAKPQATQRAITLASFEVIHAQQPDIQYFNELLVQYPVRGERRPRQVVPDNMALRHEEPIEVEGSFDVPLQPARPLLMLEYVSKSSKRKDYDDNRQKYEKELKVPYYLLFVPESEEMILFRHNGRRYVTVVPDEQGRAAIPELELQAGLLDGWLRFWFRGDLVPLPADLVRQMDQLKQRLARAEERATQAEQALEAERQARLAAEEEIARLKAQLQQPPGTEA
jgi:Uma2 family endonuclease